MLGQTQKKDAAQSAASFFWVNRYRKLVMRKVGLRLRSANLHQ